MHKVVRIHWAQNLRVVEGSLVFSNEGLFKSCKWATIARLLFFFLLKIASNIGEPNGLEREEVMESQRRGVRRTSKGGNDSIL